MWKNLAFCQGWVVRLSYDKTEYNFLKDSKRNSYNKYFYTAVLVKKYLLEILASVKLLRLLFALQF